MDLARGYRFVEDMDPEDFDYMKAYADKAQVRPIELFKSLGASIRLCGNTIANAKRIAKTRVPKNIDELVHGMQGVGIKITDKHAFVKAYKRLAKAVPSEATLVSIGSSPDKYVFMHELLGQKVAYVELSRASLSCKQIIAAFEAAGVRFGQKLAVVDFMDTGVTMNAVMAAAATSKAALTAIILYKRGHRKTLVAPPSIRLKFVCFPDEFWWHGKYLSRCVSTNHGDSLAPPFGAQILMCNLMRLWVASIVKHVGAKE